FIIPSAGSDSLLNWLLDLTGAKAIFIDLPWLEFFGEGISSAELNRSALSLKFIHRHRKGWHAGSPLYSIFFVLGSHLMFVFIKFHINAKDLCEIGFRKDLVPLRIYDLPFGDQVHVLRGTVNDLIGSRLAIQPK